MHGLPKKNPKITEIVIFSLMIEFNYLLYFSQKLSSKKLDFCKNMIYNVICLIFINKSIDFFASVAQW